MRLPILAVIPVLLTGITRDVWVQEALTRTTERHSVTVSVPPGSDSKAYCRVTPGDAARDGSHESPIYLPCSRRDALLSCDGGGLEPLDVPIPDACRAQSIWMKSAVTVTIRQAAPKALTVEWLTLTEGGHVSVIARRAYPAASQVPLLVLDSGDRFVRFLRHAASPVTVAAAEMIGADKVWTLPVAQPGGEVVAVVDAGAVVPGKVLVDGPTAVEAPRAGYVATVRGLIPGTYALRGEYGSRLTTRPTTVEVGLGRTTWVRLPVEQVGEARVTADPDVCAGSTELAIIRVTKAPDLIGATREDAVPPLRDVSRCSWAIDGLAPGEYEAVMRASGNVVASRPFVIAPQRVTETVISRPVVTVSGYVAMNGKPSSGTSVLFIPETGLTVTGMTDDRGRYSIGLASPGRYAVLLTGGGVIREMRAATVSEGENTFDVDLGQTRSLAVHLTGAIAAGPIALDLWSSDGSRVINTRTVPDGVSQVLWDGLRDGAYLVSARQADAVSDTEAVVISAEQPAPTVSLRLQANSSRLRLRDALGAPAIGITFRAFPQPNPVKTAEGDYSLAGIPPGTELRIRALGDQVPVCRRVPRDGDVDVRFQRGRQVVVEVPAAADAPDLESTLVVGVPGSDCPLRLSDFNRSPIDSVSRGVSSFAISNFPLDPGIAVVGGSGRKTITAGDETIVRIRH